MIGALCHQKTTCKRKKNAWKTYDKEFYAFSNQLKILSLEYKGKRKYVYEEQQKYE